MSERIEKYQAIYLRLARALKPGGEDLSDAQTDDLHDELDDLFEAMTDVERVQIDTWKKEQDTH